MKTWHGIMRLVSWAENLRRPTETFGYMAIAVLRISKLWATQEERHVVTELQSSSSLVWWTPW